MLLSLIVAATLSTQTTPQTSTWTADNGNGTFSNPLFFDEFSDPDLIRVGDDYYLTGTTMHTMPGLPVLHSKDLVNWKLLGYAFDRLDYGPQFRLEEGKSIYGQGIWAPCIRYNKGTFYIFSNVNGRATQVFSAKNPSGPWTHREMKRGFHDLSVLFDDDGKAYVVWGYRDLHIAQLNSTLDDIVPGTEHTPFGKDSLIGEGAHFYKIDGKYIITSAWYDGGFRMPCARANSPYGPYEVNPAISKDEAFGLTAGYRLRRDKPYVIAPPNPSGGPEWASMHQGGIVQTQKGEWWGWSMMDSNSVGRLTALSPVTWKDGWPYFGLPGNLGRTPRTWIKPNTGFSSKPLAPYTRNDDFNGPALANVWQWNHAPTNDKWSLTERKGFLRLHSLPATDFFSARNTLTQRAIGPESIPTVELDASGLKEGDIAGLGLLNHPFGWIGVHRTAGGSEIVQYDESTDTTATQPLNGTHVWLRAHCDFLTEKARFSYSVDGKNFQVLGGEFTMVFQLRTFQGVRYGLFSYGSGGGYADFTQFKVTEPRPSAFTQPIPIGKTVRFENLKDHSVLIVKGNEIVSVPASDPLASSASANFKVLDRKLGRVAIEAPDGRLVTVSGVDVSLAKPGATDSQSFQWTEMPRGDLLLLSLSSHRHLRLTPEGVLRADEPGAQYDRQNGASFLCKEPAENQTGVPGTNPILRDAFTADPAAIVYKGTVYLYTGHDEAKGKELFTMRNWLCYTSKDMKNWTPHGPLLSVKDFKWAKQDAWASQVIEKGGKFYWYVAIQHDDTKPGKAIGVAVADSPLGPFRDARGSALITDDMTKGPYPWDDIDPTVFTDADGTTWMSWGNGTCYLAKLKPNMIELDGPIQKIDVPYYTEGPWLHKRGNLYYLTYAAFAHQGKWEKICYATAPKITGPWTYRGILTDQTKDSFTIHPAIIEFKKQWYLLYHNASLVLNGERGAVGRRSVCLEYLFYNPDGTIRPITQTIEGVSLPPKK